MIMATARVLALFAPTLRLLRSGCPASTSVPHTGYGPLLSIAINLETVFMVETPNAPKHVNTPPHIAASLY
jgi:hypothetical protein